MNLTKHLRQIKPDRNVYLWWPVKLRWYPASLRSHLRFHLFTTHGFQVGYESCSFPATGRRCMPCRREVYGWTFHLGPLKVVFGDVPEVKAIGCHNCGREGLELSWVEIIHHTKIGRASGMFCEECRAELATEIECSCPPGAAEHRAGCAFYGRPEA